MKKLFSNAVINGLLFGIFAIIGMVLTGFILVKARTNSNKDIPLASSGEKLNLTKWNQVLERVKRIYRDGSDTLEVDGNIKLEGAAPTYKISNVATTLDGDNANVVTTKGYVDAKVVSAGGYSSCPVQITNEQSSVTIANAIKNCNDLTTDGGGRRLPTFEELACFVGSSTSSTYLWTRSSRPDLSGYYLELRLLDGSRYYKLFNTQNLFRCVR